MSINDENKAFFKAMIQDLKDDLRAEMKVMIEETLEKTYTERIALPPSSTSIFDSKDPFLSTPFSSPLMLGQKRVLASRSKIIIEKHVLFLYKCIVYCNYYFGRTFLLITWQKKIC
jgi:hypothetical protein